MSKKKAIFNKGERSFDLGDVVIKPKCGVNLDVKLADKLLEKYPREIVLPRGDVVEVDVSALEDEIKALKKEVKILNKQLEAATAPDAIPAE